MKYEALQLANSSRTLIVKGGWNPDGNLTKDIYVLDMIPSSSDVSIGIQRMDQAALVSESEGSIKIREMNVAFSYWLKENSTVIKKLEETDKIANAKASGIILPEGSNDPGLIR